MVMETSRHEGNHHFVGQVSYGGTVVFPPATVTNASFTSDPSLALAATKQEHQFQLRHSQVHASDATAERRVLHLVRGLTGDSIEFECGNVIAATGNSTVTIDVYKNGTTILSAPVVLDNANTAYAKESGTISVAALAAGDVIEIVQTISAGSGTLPRGVFAQLTIREDAE
jgi:hypothetical protein